MNFAFNWMSLVNIFIFLVILCLTISIHELGHLLFAKKFNVYCYEYSIGFGKAIYTNKKGETHFCIRMIPLGGFVKMAGEEALEDGQELLDNNNQPIPKERIFSNAKKLPRILILAAGGIFNMILAYICFFIFLMGYGVAITDQPYIQIVDNGAIAQQNENLPTTIYIHEMNIWITENETIVDGSQVEGTPQNFNEISSLLNEVQPTNATQQRHMELTYSSSESDTNYQNATVTSKVLTNKDDKGQNVYSFDKVGFQVSMKKYGFFEAIPQTFVFMGEYFVQICKAFGELFVGKFENLSGLVGIYEVVDQASSLGVTPLIYIIGAISFSLGFFNLMPIPALDGGRIVFVLIEAITRKKVNPNVEGWIHTIGFLLLFGLMIIINIKDIIGLF